MGGNLAGRRVGHVSLSQSTSGIVCVMWSELDIQQIMGQNTSGVVSVI